MRQPKKGGQKLPDGAALPPLRYSSAAVKAAISEESSKARFTTSAPKALSVKMPPNSAPIKNSNSSTTADNGLSICRKTDGGRIFPTAKPSSSKPDTDKTGKREVMICSHLFVGNRRIVYTFSTTYSFYFCLNVF